MGGAWVDWPAASDPDRLSRYRQMTNIAGCFNCGESDYLYHGANRLGANSLLSCIFGGLVTAHEVDRFCDTVTTTERPETIFSQALAIEEAKRAELFSRTGPENTFKLYDELADWMVRFVTVTRNNQDLKRTIDKILEIKERNRHTTLPDMGRFANQSYIFASQFEPMLEIAHVITKCALLRDESRGSHAKSEFSARNDSQWLKTSIATWNPVTQEPDITYRDVDTRHVSPVLRDYSTAQKVVPTFDNLPQEMPLPV